MSGGAPPDAPVGRERPLGQLIGDGSRLHIGCTRCRKSRSMGALEAVASYGGLLTPSEVKLVIRSRCRAGRGCAVDVRPALDDTRKRPSPSAGADDTNDG